MTLYRLLLPLRPRVQARLALVWFERAMRTHAVAALDAIGATALAGVIRDIRPDDDAAVDALREKVWANRFAVEANVTVAGISAGGDMSPVWATVQAAIAAGDSLKRMSTLTAPRTRSASPHGEPIAISVFGPRSLTEKEHKQHTLLAADVSWHTVSAATEASRALSGELSSDASDSEWRRQEAEVNAALDDAER